MPILQAFTLKVSSSVGIKSTYVTQEFLSVTGEKYIRRYDQYIGSGTWSPWQKYVLNSDLYKVFTIGNNTTFSAVLNGRNNKVTPFAFYTPKDNPFSFSAGYGIAFNALIHHDEKMFTLIAFSKTETKMEIKEFTIT